MISVAPWFKARDVTLAGGDVTVEIHTDPPVVEGQITPLHTFLIAGLGMPIIDDFDPEALAEMCARLHRWEFMLVVAAPCRKADLPFRSQSAGAGLCSSFPLTFIRSLCIF